MIERITGDIVSKTLSLRIDDELHDWLDGYVESRSASKTQVVELALRELRAAAAAMPRIPELPPLKRRGRRPGRERICFRCLKCISREFYRVLPAAVPECPDGHGPMVRDPNDHRSIKLGGSDVGS